MKKLFFIIAVCIMAICTCCCTQNKIAKTFGGTATIKLPAGQKLVEVTWKESNLWYLTEPMEDGYVPKTKTFAEDSNFGIVEGCVIFIETK